MEKPTFESTKLKLSQIERHEALLLVASEAKGYLEPNQEVIARRKRLSDDYGYRDRLLIWKSGAHFYLLANYEQFKALEPLGHEHEVDCLIANCGFEVAKSIATRLQQLQYVATKETHYERLTNLLLLQKLGYTLDKVKREYGAESSADKKRIERDWKLIQNPALLIRVLGWDSETTVTQFCDKFMPPRPDEATIKYSTALTVASIFGHDPKQIADFIAEEYSDYLTALSPSNDTEHSEPKHNWKNYSVDRVLALAQSAARKSKFLSTQNRDSVGDHGLDDVRSEIIVDNKTGTIRITDISVDLRSKDQRSIKKICETLYIVTELKSILDTYLRAVQPSTHGDQIPFADHSVDQFINHEQSNFAISGRGYLLFVKNNRILRYANRERLLRSLSLAPHNFGFRSRDYGATSTYRDAEVAFRDWYNTSHLKTVSLRFNGQPDRHPLHEHYQEIFLFLEGRKHLLKQIYFGEFVLEMFSDVFKAVDRQSRELHERATDIVRAGLVFKGGLHQSTLDKIKQSGLSESEVADLSRAYARFDNRDLLEAVSAIADQVTEVAKVLPIRPETLTDEGAQG